MGGVGGRVGEKNRGADYECERNEKRTLPAGLDSVRDGGVQECADDSSCVDGGGVIVLLNYAVAAGFHPQGEYII